MTAIEPRSLDHVALWVADRDPLADFLCEHLGMHGIERTDSFTLLGVDAREGKLTLFAAEGPRERGVLERVVLRVSDLERAERALPADLPTESLDGVMAFEAPQGLAMGLVAADGLEYDLDHVVLRVGDPDGVRAALVEMGFEGDDGRLRIADRHVRLRHGEPVAAQRPLLNHLAVLVESADEARREAEARGWPIAKVVDAENTLAVFVDGPGGIQVEYVEHKPGFSLT